MKKIISIIALLFFLCSCRASDEMAAIQTADDKSLSWAFIQFVVPEDNGETEAYYLYGQVSERLLDSIANNQIEHGFILLRNVRYWGDNNTIQQYRDGENTGELVYRIEDIRRIRMVRTEPRVGMGYEQFNALEKESDEKTASPRKADNKL